jgi:hypothetical protein
MNRSLSAKTACANVESRAAFPHLHITAATEDGYDLKKRQRIVLTEMQLKSDNGQ